jgi:hypothetical protein
MCKKLNNPTTSSDLFRFLLLHKELASANRQTAEIHPERKFLVDPMQNIIISKANCHNLRLFPGKLHGIIDSVEINNKMDKQIVCE